MIVVDTSVALQWLLIESDAAQAETLIARDDVAAPDIILLEAANVLNKRVDERGFGHLLAGALA